MDQQSFINNDSDSIPPSIGAARVGSNIGSMLVRIMWESIMDEAKEELKQPNY